MYYSTNYQSPIGSITLVADENNNLAGLWLEGQKHFGGSAFSQMLEKEDLEVFVRTKKWLDRYFTGGKPNIDELPLSPIGREFRQNVWKLLCEIPYGEVVTYGDIAKKIAGNSKKQMSARAVGGAVGHNPIPIIIPCHRVIGANKNLTGFSGGISKKIKLLQIEGYDTSKLVVPTNK